MGFVSLHTHTDNSNYGMYDSIARIDDIIKRVHELGQTTWAITDHGTCSGVMEAYTKVKKFNKKNNCNQKVILGAELYFTNEILIKGDTYHIILLAQNNIGLQNLYKITTIAHGNKGLEPDNFYKKSRTDLKTLTKHKEGLYIGTACLGGFINQPNGEEILKQFKEVFGENLFIELHTYQAQKQYDWNKQLIEYAQKYDIPMVAAVDSHYVLKDHADAHRKYVSNGKEKEFGYYETDDYYLHSEEEVRKKLSYLPSQIVNEAIENTVKIADNCNVEIDFSKKHYPVIKGEVDNKEKLLQICRDNFRWKVPDKSKWQEHAKRIKEVELPVLEAQDYISYFLITHNILDYCNKNGIPTAPGRGSVIGCDIAYLMNITKLSPLEYNCPFERFANMERISPPDIDNDIGTKNRGKVIQYIKDTFGEVYQCRTFQVNKASGALRAAGKALGYEAQFINDLAKHLPDNDDDDEEMNDYDKQLYLLEKARTDELKELFDLARIYVGVKKGFGKHAGAVIILNEDINQFCSVERQRDSQTREIHYLAACDFRILEEMGVLKIDALGVTVLDNIYDTLGIIPDKIDIDNIPLDDKRTFDMLCKGLTNGVFQLSSNGMTKLVKDIQPRHYKDLIPLVALFRPGCLGAKYEDTNYTMVDMYVRRRQGKEPIEYLHPKLEPILQETYGIILYQEQILQIVQSLCGYTLGEADVLRRIIGKKKLEEMKPAMEKMIKCGIDNGIEPKIMTKISQQIETFAEYGFNKGHSVGYSFVAYQTAFLKANYDRYFLLCCINNRSNQEDIIPFINECKKLNIPILPPDTTKSKEYWILEGDGIRVGLTYIRDVGKNLVIADTLEDIMKLNDKKTLTGLIKAGALDQFGKRIDLLRIIYPHEQYLHEVELINKRLPKYNLDDAKDKRLYDKSIKELAKVEAKEKYLQNYDDVKAEIEVLGMSFKQLPKIKEGVLKSLKVFKDSKQRDMCRVALDSEYGLFECVIFFSDFRKWKNILVVGNKYKFIADSGIIKDIKGVD